MKILIDKIVENGGNRGKHFDADGILTEVVVVVRASENFKSFLLPSPPLAWPSAI